MILEKRERQGVPEAGGRRRGVAGSSWAVSRCRRPGAARARHWWSRLWGAGPVVLDRRLGGSRRQAGGWGRERRRGERRRPAFRDLSAVTTHLGTGTRWQGELRFRGILHIDGAVEGPGIAGEILLLGESARVRAALDVDVLQVRGQLEGELRVRRWVELQPRSRVRGTIWAPRVEIWPGALLQGTCHVGDSPVAFMADWTGHRAVGNRPR